MPHNLSAYLDFGFEVVNSKQTNLEKNWINFDFTPVAEYLRKHYDDFSISKVGALLNISIGPMGAKQNGQTVQLVSGLHNYIEIMQDGSIRGRILLCCDKEYRVDIGSVLYAYKCFREIYKRIFGEEFCKYFIYAREYERLTVLKQFSTFYSDFDEDEKLKNYYNQHKEKYGNILIINGNRMPFSDYFVIDKRYIENKGKEFNNDNLLTELFTSGYANLGYIDLPL